VAEEDVLDCRDGVYIIVCYVHFSTAWVKRLLRFSNYLQLRQSYAMLSATTQLTSCSKCSPSAATHAGWSQLIWHNFVNVGDNWIKICILAWIGKRNKRAKFGLKIHNRSGGKCQKTSEGIFIDSRSHTVYSIGASAVKAWCTGLSMAWWC